MMNLLIHNRLICPRIVHAQDVSEADVFRSSQVETKDVIGVVAPVEMDVRIPEYQPRLEGSTTRSTVSLTATVLPAATSTVSVTGAHSNPFQTSTRTFPGRTSTSHVPLG